MTTEAHPAAGGHDTDDLSERLAAAVTPLLERVGGHLVGDDDARPDDVPILWDGVARLHVRLGHNDDALSGYRIAATLCGAAADAGDAAARALARLDLR